MRIHTNSQVKGTELFTGISPLRNYSDSIVHVKIDKNDLEIVTLLIAQFDLESLPDSLLLRFFNLFDNGIYFKSNNDSSEIEKEEYDSIQFSLIFSLFKYLGNPLTMGKIKAYALKLDISLSSKGFESILEGLEDSGILVAQINKGVIEYTMYVELLDNVFALEG